MLRKVCYIRERDFKKEIEELRKQESDRKKASRLEYFQNLDEEEIEELKRQESERIKEYRSKNRHKSL